MKLNSTRATTKKHPIKNKLIYYGFMVEKNLTFLMIMVPFYLFNYFFDSISNKNNHNWPPEKREIFLGYILFGFYTGMTIGSFGSGLLADFNMKKILNLAKILIGLMYLPILFGDITIMVLGWFCLGILSEFVQITMFWYPTQVAIPKHKELMVALTGVGPSICLVLLGIFSKLDNGGYWYWRTCLIVVCGSLIILAGIDYFLFDVNSLSYLITHKGREGAIENLKTYLDDNIAEEMVAKFIKDLEIDKEENQLDLQPSHQNELQKLFSIAKTFKNELLNVLLITFLVFMSPLFSFYQIGLYYGSKELDDREAVSTTKTYLIISAYIQLITGILNSIFVFNKKRKTFLLFSVALSCFALSLTILGYITNNLFWSRISLSINTCGDVGIFSALFTYAIDLLPPNLIFVAFLLARIIAAIDGAIYPRFLQFETTNYRGIALKLSLILSISWVCYLLIIKYMLRTKDMTKEEIHKFLRSDKNLEQLSESLELSKSSNNTVFL